MLSPSKEGSKGESTAHILGQAELWTENESCYRMHTLEHASPFSFVSLQLFKFMSSYTLSDQYKGEAGRTEVKLLIGRSLTVDRLYLKLFEPPHRERCRLRAHRRLLHCLIDAESTTRRNWPALTMFLHAQGGFVPTPRCKM